MVSEMWQSVEQMGTNDVKKMIRDIRSKGSNISLEERITLYFGLVKLDYLDNAMFQMQMIYNEIKEKGLNSDFLSKHPDLKIRLMSTFRVWEDSCGRIHVDDASGECDDCGTCFCGCGGCFGILFLITMCCGSEGLDFVFSPIDPTHGWCCNCVDGGCCTSACCNDCCTGICKELCGFHNL